MSSKYINVNDEGVVIRVVDDVTEIPEWLKGGFIFEGEFPPMKNIRGKSAIIKYDYDTNEIYYDYIDRPLTMEERIESLQQTSTQKYQDIKLTGTLEEVRAAKIEQLKEACTQAIYDGFMSPSLGKQFGFNDKDQMNLGQQYLLVVSGDNDGALIPWKSKQGIVNMTEQEFRTLIIESRNHKIDNQIKYWQLEDQVLKATSIRQIDEIKW